MSPNPYQSETLGYAVGLKDLRRKSSRVDVRGVKMPYGSLNISKI